MPQVETTAEGWPVELSAELIRRIEKNSAQNYNKLFPEGSHIEECRDFLMSRDKELSLSIAETEKLMKLRLKIHQMVMMQAWDRARRNGVMMSALHEGAFFPPDLFVDWVEREDLFRDRQDIKDRAKKLFQSTSRIYTCGSRTNKLEMIFLEGPQTRLWEQGPGVFAAQEN